MVTAFYKNLFTLEGTTNMHKVIDVVPRKVTNEMNQRLLSEYSGEEIKTALF